MKGAIRNLVFLLVIVCAMLSGCRQDDPLSVGNGPEESPKAEQTKNPPLSPHFQPDDAKVDFSAIKAILKEQNELNLDRDYVLSQYQFKTEGGRGQVVDILLSNKLGQGEKEQCLYNLFQSVDERGRNEQEGVELLKKLQVLREGNLSADMMLFEQYINSGLSIEAIEEVLQRILLGKENFNHPFLRKAYQQILGQQAEKLLDDANFPYYRLLELVPSDKLAEPQREFYLAVSQHVQARIFKKILANHQLIGKTAQLRYTNRAVMPMDWSISYSTTLGRCAGASKTIHTQGIEDWYGQDCNYDGGDSTKTSVMLGYNVKSYDLGPVMRYAGSVGSYIRGGFADRGDENQTAGISYKIHGRQVIPACDNPLLCWPFVKVVRLGNEDLPYFSAAPRVSSRNSSVSITVGGKTLNVGDTLWVDRSQGDVEINITATRSDTHVGACCEPVHGQDSFGVDIVGVKVPSLSVYDNGPVAAKYSLGSRGMFGYYLPGLTGANSFGADLVHASEIDFDRLGLMRGIPEDLLKRQNTKLEYLVNAGQDWVNARNYNMTTFDSHYWSYYGSLHLINWLLGTRSPELNSQDATYLTLLRGAIVNEARSHAAQAAKRKKGLAQQSLVTNPLKLVLALKEKVAVAYENNFEQFNEEIRKIAESLSRLANSLEAEELRQVADLLKEQESLRRQNLLFVLRELQKILPSLQASFEENTDEFELTVLELRQYEE